MKICVWTRGNFADRWKVSKEVRRVLLMMCVLGIHRQIDQRARNNRSIMIDSCACELNISHGKNQCKKDLSLKKYSILLELENK
jgi:hypothetical protein